MTDKKRVLLVDDNEADNVYHEIILRRCAPVGEVRMMESAEAALQTLQQSAENWPDVMFVDLNMPGMDGFAFVQALDKLHHSTPVKVVILTSSDAAQDRDRATQLHSVSSYIIKPLTVRVVMELLSD